MWNKSLCNFVLENGGRIKPLIIDGNDGLGLCNPSPFNDNGKLLLNLRGVNYTLHHSEFGTYQTPWGPINYVRPDDNQKLETTNFFCELDNNLNIVKSSKVDTSKLDVEPKWTFTGLEDVRVVKWDDTIFLSGGRRDILPNGDGKTELATISIDGNNVREVSRNRIDAPGTEYSYLEKNWMPINDRPYQFVRWANPIEIVEVDIKNNTSDVVYSSDNKIDLPREVRGSSSVVAVGDKYIFITHETDFWHNRKNDRNVKYYHRFWIVDRDWNVLKVSDTFKFMHADVEFCAGMCKYNDSLLITFGFMDNSAYILDVPIDLFFEFMETSLDLKWKDNKNYKSIHGYVFPDSQYKSSSNEKLRFEFNGLENVLNNYSDSYQDMFVLSILDGKRNGTYLEIGAAEGYFHNNTALLEDTFNWKGISVEIDDAMVKDFRENRGNEVIHNDALKLDYIDVLSKISDSSNIVDYLQVDCEPAEVTFEILKKIPFDKFKFRVITFEHDFYVSGERVRKESREYLESLGYILVVDNISPHFSEDKPFEDWWVHPELIDTDILKKMKCVDGKVKNSKKYMTNSL